MARWRLQRRSLTIASGACLVLAIALVAYYLLRGNAPEHTIVLGPNTDSQATGVPAMRVVPSTGTFKAGTTFAVKLLIDGAGQAFNTAQATVRVAGSARVQTLTPGNCNFTFMTKPTVDRPSFIGARLGSSSTGCTVYTMHIRVTGTAPISVSLTNAQVLSAAGAANILSTVADGTYNSSAH